MCHLLGESELITCIQNNVPEACAGGLEDGGGGGQRGGGRGCDQEQLSIPKANVDDNSFTIRKGIGYQCFHRSMSTVIPLKIVWIP